MESGRRSLLLRRAGGLGDLDLAECRAGAVGAEMDRADGRLKAPR